MFEKWNEVINVCGALPTKNLPKTLFSRVNRQTVFVFFARGCAQRNITISRIFYMFLASSTLNLTIHRALHLRSQLLYFLDSSPLLLRPLSSPPHHLLSGNLFRNGASPDPLSGQSFSIMARISEKMQQLMLNWGFGINPI